MRDGSTSLERSTLRPSAHRIDALIDVVVAIYAPLPRASLSMVVSRLRYAVPQWRRHLRAGLDRALVRLSQARVDGLDWYWPAGERPERFDTDEAVRLLSPFDPVVWDRRRFELLWGWAYRFEAYTPVVKRQRGYYALPLLWRDRVIGWANVSWRDGALQSDVGYIGARAPSDRRVQPRPGGGATEDGKISCQHGKTLT